MKKKKITIYDVAKEANVSLATVSRVINGSNVVKDKTKQRVLDVIDRLDFKPNEIARGLAMSKTTTIAVVFPQSLVTNVRDMISGIGDTGRHLGYNINIYTTDNLGDNNAVADVTEKVIKSRVDGVILFDNPDIDYMISSMQRHSVPLVVIGKQISDENIGSIFIDIHKATMQVVDNYLEKGKKDIIYVTSEQSLVGSEVAVAGIKEAYAKHGLVFNDSNILTSPREYTKSYPMFKEYLKNKKHDLVFCGYDQDGVAVMNAAKANGLSIPNDMEVMGMSDATYSIMCQPTLSSMHVPIYDMGALAIRLLTKFLQDELIESKEISVQYTFIERESTKG